MPYAFTEYGVAMLSGVLRSETAVAANIRIMRAFADMRRLIPQRNDMAERIEVLEYNQLAMRQQVDATSSKVDLILDKRTDAVAATIYTSGLNKQLRLDIARHNSQYPPIDVRTFSKAHDRFLIIDDEVYLIGASIKDLGKKWFGFTLMENTSATELLSRIN